MDSEIMEILNILRPPVKKDPRKQQDYIIINSSDGDLVSDLSKLGKVEEQKNSKLTQESSFSLILQRTCKKQIFEKYSFVNGEISHHQKQQVNENISDLQNKPTIKVTVIPKNDKYSVNKLFQSQNQVTKITKNTKKPTSNDGKYIATKNLYFIVAGRKEEKIYKIKTTGSKTFNKDKNVKKAINPEPIILTMEKKRKKLIETESAEDKNLNDVCLCNCRRDSFLHDAGVGSSRVKIFGRIGLNENDNYVMKCAATVNGQPVTTDYIRSEKNPNFRSLLDVESSAKTVSESQATQVDIGLVTNRRPTHDQKIQCNSKDFSYLTSSPFRTENIDFDTEYRINTLKGSNSPLVIISVYPNQESNNFKVNRIAENTSPKRQIQNSNNQNQINQSNLKEVNKPNNYYRIKTEVPTSRGRSPKKINESLAPEANKTEDTKNTTSNTIKSFRASRSASPTNKSPKSKTREMKYPVFTENYYVRSNNSRNQSPNRLLTNETKQGKDANSLKQIKGITIDTNNIEVRRQRNANTGDKSKSLDKNNNTVKVQANSTPAEKFTKKISHLKTNKKSITIKNDDMPVNRNLETVIRKSYPRNDVSKVSVNIDSEKEFYDVTFEKGKYSTDLTVRKTTREIGSQKYFEESFEENFENNPGDSRKSDSLENFFPLEVIGRHRRSISQAFNNISDDLPLSEQNMSKLHVRDSLEIGHRRDEKDLKAQPSKRLFREYDCIEDNEGGFSTPIKHFPGDNCIISDPVERDKKIRELLGIHTTKRGKATDKTQKRFKQKVNRSDSSSMRKSFSESLITSQMVKKCSCSCCTKIKMTMESESNNINVSSNEKQNSSIDIPKEKNSVQTDETPLLTELENFVKNKVEIPIVVMQSVKYEAQKNKTELMLNQKPIQLTRKQYRKLKNSLHKLSEKKHRNNSFASVGTKKSTFKNEHSIHLDKEAQTDLLPEETLRNKHLNNSKNKELNTDSYQESHVFLYSREKSADKLTSRSRNKKVKKVASSIEIRVTDIKSMKEVTCSHTDIESLGLSSRKKYHSIETIFRGRKKSHTPNLGASALSLLTEEVKSVSESQSPDSKPKKPFLRRLMSCLVMRSATSEIKLPKRKRQEPTINSSIDSYHINTSVAAMEMSSSIYDTSASFYSNYTIGPVNKAKRGFFSSVREFLTTKKS